MVVPEQMVVSVNENIPFTSQNLTSAIVWWIWATIKPDNLGSEANSLILSAGCSCSSKQSKFLAFHFPLDCAKIKVFHGTQWG